MPKPRVYLASPLGFAESTRAFMDALIPLLEEHVDVENPWDDVRFVDEFHAVEQLDSVSERRSRLGAVNREIGHSNVERIDRSDAVFAILDGVDVDSGTAAEIGYGFAKGKHVCGLRTDFRLAGDNEAAIVNLQVEYFIRASGGEIVTSMDELIALARDLSEANIPTSP